MVQQYNSEENARHRITMECNLGFTKTVVLKNHAKLGIEIYTLINFLRAQKSNIELSYLLEQSSTTIL